MRYWSSGSSPLARGTLGIRKWIKAPRGLIPARAGNTPRSQEVGILERAHPRSRGEHNPGAFTPPAPVGSSPLARGTPHQRTPGFQAWGLIPARAGNTEHVTKVTDAAGAHPRSRGEHCGGWCRRGWRAGSSPLARGTPRRGIHQLPQRGLIPARAGNTTRHS